MQVDPKAAQLLGNVLVFIGLPAFAILIAVISLTTTAGSIHGVPVREPLFALILTPLFFCAGLVAWSWLPQKMTAWVIMVIPGLMAAYIFVGSRGMMNVSMWTCVFVMACSALYLAGGLRLSIGMFTGNSRRAETSDW